MACYFGTVSHAMTRDALASHGIALASLGSLGIAFDSLVSLGIALARCHWPTYYAAELAREAPRFL